MFVLQIEHPVPNFDAWKKAFDDDPIGRAKAGVRRHRVMRAGDDPNYVMIDLEFDSVAQAEAVHAALRQMWSRVQQEGLIGGQQARIVEVAEDKAYL